MTLLGSEDQGGAQLTTAFHELPSRGRWIHLSYMAGRSPKAIKLYGMMPRAELIAYLTRIGWAGSMRAVEAALADLYPERILGNELYLDLNLENFRDSERATLGLAAAQQHLNRPDSDPTRAEILAHWLKAGLCAFPKVDRVRTWPASAWDVPQNLFMQELRYLDLKLVWQAPTGWIAKAYLGRRQRRGIF